MPQFDVVGLGLNATDTLLVLPEFPAYAGKARFEQEIVSPGGQVATAMATCVRLGLRAKYIGTVGDDERGRIQLASLREAGVDVEHVIVRRSTETQSAYILIDSRTGERTVLWKRPASLRLRPSEIAPEQITCGRLLHVDGCDTDAAECAVRIARSAGIPVTVDVDTVYPGFDKVLANVDYLICDATFASEWTGERDPFKALSVIQDEYRMRLAGTTLGAWGALVRCAGVFSYSPGYVVHCADTTGAGDVFHGAFCYAVLRQMPIPEALDFANAMAALNCTALGARGAIKSEAEARELMRRAERRSHPDFAAHRQPVASS